MPMADIKSSSEKPLAGAIICCTSVPAEIRSQYAEWAEEMGAEHSLDLTSGVTHLLVADTNTEKYRYVAREREDIKVLRPEWLDAVRTRWMEDAAIDHNMLEKEYRMPTFVGLKICITGFDDLTFRALLQKNIVENGGEYTGDLTKEVTHLIAAKTEGKKYEYAMLWQLKVVSLKWYRDSLDRGMQLDEECYHPGRPAEEQGKGAWNRKIKFQPVLGKRSSSGTAAVEPQRKLRRTASAKFGSQTDGLWNEIVAGPGSEVPDESNKPPLRPSKSMPTMQSSQQNEIPKAVIDMRHEFLAHTSFVVLGFDEKKTAILRKVLGQHGANMYDNLSELDEQKEFGETFVVVPYTSSKDRVENIMGATVVTELWIEKCMEAKAFVNPEEYPLGTLAERVRSPETSRLVINATGFHGIECLHISKVVKLIGANYQETFTSCISVLVCKSASINPDKVRHAVEWNVPIVSEAWLHSLIRNGRVPSTSRYHFPGIGPQAIKGKQQNDNNRRKATEGFDAELKNKERSTEPNHAELQDKQREDMSRSKALQEVARPGADFRVHEEQPDRKAKHKAPDTDKEAEPVREQPLREISPNPLPVQHEGKRIKKRLFRNLDGADSGHENNAPEPLVEDSMLEDANAAPDECDDGPGVPEELCRAPEIVRDAGMINGAIQELLDLKAKTKQITPSDDSLKKKKLLGRALSNLSNSSRTSQNHATRASSVDSINTEGLGREIVPSHSNTTTENEARVQRGSSSILTGRASERPATDALQITLDEMMSRDGVPEAEPEPQLTQLGYEDPEEAIQLREALAERRRAKAKLGQKAIDPKPLGQQKSKKLQDDDLMSAASGGWGGARRTRQRDKI